jgi:transcription initiation factor IIF auxiliary subunit
VSLEIRQSSTYLGKERWEWSVWVDGPAEELDAIDHVTYILDSTFRDPVRTIEDRSTNFRLTTSGWGTFTIAAKVVQKDASEILLQHDLALSYPDGAQARA